MNDSNTQNTKYNTPEYKARQKKYRFARENKYKEHWEQNDPYNSETKEKKCAECKQVKNIQVFSRCSKTKDGLQHTCDECAHIRNKERQEKNKQFWLNKSPYETNGNKTKTCQKCKQELELANFSLNGTSKDGLQKCCKECQLKKARIKKYGIENPKSYTCDICGCTPKTIQIDHCHATGKTRGSLCQHCNYALGFFKDSLETIAKASEYLKQWHTVNGLMTDGHPTTN